MTKIILIVLGVSVEVTGVDNKNFQEPCEILTFTHASNLDGFLVSMSCPVSHYALGKKELFLIPFFSWLALAIGGVPVDRSDRTRAVNALTRSSASAAARGKDGKKTGNSMCLVIAPEGTRSPTGNLLPFKKGACIHN
jgi:1-acyl-sn-glycerol-3-phosphate acyltransferase